jgi:NADPH:quinone reductase-like Zn-dependent oxidoreductase
MSKKEQTNELNFKVLGRLVLLEPKREIAGIDLSFVKDHPLDLPVVAVGDEVTKVKVGDKVVCNGNTVGILIDGLKYLIINEHQVIGVALNDVKVTTEVETPTPIM